MDANIIPLQQFYLAAIVAVANDQNLSAIQQEFEAGTGRLWLVRDGSSVPQLSIIYNFGPDYVSLALESRDERKRKDEVKYAEGLDGYLEKLHAFITANRLEAPKS